MRNKTNRITIICKDDADPKLNRIQLRTTPPSYIELQPGVNVLRVRDYPALKYGFKQIDMDEDGTYQDNCQDVIRVNLSQFDGSEMTSMSEMFHYMKSLEEVNFHGLDTSKVESMESLFEMTPKVKRIDLRKLDTSNVEDMSQMCWGSSADIDLSNLDVSNVKSMQGIFSCGEPKSVNLTGWQVDANCDMEEFFDNKDIQIFNLQDSNICIYRDGFGIKNNFKLTENAKRFQEFFPETHFFESVEECLNSIAQLRDSDWSPNVFGGLKEVDSLLSDLKAQLENKHDVLVKSRNCDKISRGITHNLEFVLKHTTFYIVTEDDEAYLSPDKHISFPAVNVTVNNCFFDKDGKELTLNGIPTTREIPVPTMELPMLGVYLPGSGTIMLWIDRIRAYKHPVLIFQMVLVHEIIHALMDISPREITKDNGTIIIGDSSNKSKEETYDNTLVLRSYSNTQKYYDMVREFISKQLPKYSVAVDEYDKEETVYKKNIENHLAHKLNPTAPDMPGKPQYILGYNVDEETLNDKEDEFSDNYNKIITKLKTYFPVVREIGPIRKIVVVDDRRQSVSIYLYWSNGDVSYRFFFTYMGENCLYDSAKEEVYSIEANGQIVKTFFEDNKFCKMLAFIAKCIDPDSQLKWKDLYKEKP
ncbi:MAG: BspA family leucine-rich repeat surface protein [Muribaculum sp.]|nr:BspA family leucine-rich repeat surface protein [Muribaculum sp.]